MYVQFNHRHRQMSGLSGLYRFGTKRTWVKMSVLSGVSINTGQSGQPRTFSWTDDSLDLMERESRHG
jgi:hypothetical protein